MAEWVEEQRQQDEQARREALERGVGFEVGDHALHAKGRVKILTPYMGSYSVALLEDIENGRDPDDVAFTVFNDELKPLPEG